MKKLSVIMALLVLPLVCPAQMTEMTLDECLRLAADNDPYLKNSKLDVQAAREQAREAVWSFFPQVSVNSMGFYALDPLFKITVTDVLGHSDMAYNINESLGTYARENGLNPYYSTLKSGFSVGVGAIQPIYAGGRIVNGNRLARLGVEAATLQSRIKEKETAEEVEMKYWRIVALQEKAVTLREARSLLDTVYRDVSNAVNAGLAVSSDIDAVNLKRKELDAGEVKLKAGLKLAKMDIFNAIGVQYSVLALDGYHFQGDTDRLPAPSEVIVPDDEISTFEESRLLGVKVEAERLEKRMYVGEMLPQVALGAGYGYSNLFGRKDGNLNGVGVVTVKIPLTDIGKAVSRSKRYDYSIQKARNEQDYLDAQLLLQLHKLQIDMESSWDQLEISLQAVKDARKSLDRALAEYGAGRVTLSELMKCRLEYQTLSEECVNRRMEYRTAVNNYLHRCGKR